MVMINFVIIKIPLFLLVNTAVLARCLAKSSSCLCATRPPLVVGKKYVQYLFETELLSRNRPQGLYRGTETVKTTTIHACPLNEHELMNDHTDAIIYDPSTSNKIERWWRQLDERLDKFFKE